LSAYAVKEKQKTEEEFKRLDGTNHQKEVYRSKLKFEIFTEAFNKYFKAFPEIYCGWLEPITPQIKGEFAIANIVPQSVLHVSKLGRIVLVQNKISKNKMVIKCMYRWKLVAFNEEEKLLKVLYKFSRFVTGDLHKAQSDNIANYYCTVDSTSLVFMYMKFYV
jgi:hypothetical protein